MDIDGKRYKMSGSSPVVHNRLYPYYITQQKPLGKDVHVQCDYVDQKVESWLSKISVSEDRLPLIQEEYRKQVSKYKEDGQDVQIKKIQTQFTQLKAEESRLARLFIAGKTSDEAYNQLRLEWHENISVVESKIAIAKRNINAVMVDLDIAITLLSKCSVLFNRLDE
jgi:hypothetical protein